MNIEEKLDQCENNSNRNDSTKRDDISAYTLKAYEFESNTDTGSSQSFNSCSVTLEYRGNFFLNIK